MESRTERVVGDVTVSGVDVDEQTRCAHYHGERDIIAIQFRCCGQWFPCHRCHAEFADHAPEVWPKEEFNTPAVLCGACAYQLTVDVYLEGGSTCPNCSRDFNPGCAKHYDLYFET